MFRLLFAIMCHEQFQCNLNVHVNRKIKLMLQDRHILDFHFVMRFEPFPVMSVLLALPGHFCAFQLEQIDNSCNLRQLT